jgi:hypothetical protein
MEGTLILVLFIIGAILSIILVPRFLIQRAFSQVIRTFQDYNAVGKKNARTIDELGLNPPTFTQRLFRFRDYKPQALEMLKKADIILDTDDGRLYLSEEKIANSSWLQKYL